MTHDHDHSDHDHSDHDHSEHGHAHDHDDHAPIEEQDPVGEFPILATALRELLQEKGYFDADTIRGWIEKMDEKGEALGGKIVAKAWTDPDFMARLLADGRKTLEEDFDLNVMAADVVAVENTEDVHNVIVCTLCSCYPTGILGRPPDWYKSQPYRARVVREPRAVLREFGTVLPDNLEVRVHDSTADMRYIVIPKRPDGTADMTEAELAGLVTRDAMVGVTVVKAPVE